MDDSLDDKKFYDELLNSWRHYASWREKIFAGYIVALAGLGVAFSQNSSHLVRAAVFAGAVLVSIVFDILDLRNLQFINACQNAGANFEHENKAGCCRALTSVRQSDNVATLGLGIMLLVTGVSSASVSGAYIELFEWQRPNVKFSKMIAVTLGAATFLFLPTVLRWCSGRLDEFPRSLRKAATRLAWLPRGIAAVEPKR